MNKRSTLLATLAVLYSEHCILLDFNPGENLYDEPKVTLGIDRNFKEITIQGKIKLRGPHLVDTFKTGTFSDIDTEYKYVDKIPSPEEYVARLNFSIMEQRLLYKLIIDQLKRC